MAALFPDAQHGFWGQCQKPVFENCCSRNCCKLPCPWGWELFQCEHAWRSQHPTYRHQTPLVGQKNIVNGNQFYQKQMFLVFLTGLTSSGFPSTEPSWLQWVWWNSEAAVLALGPLSWWTSSSPFPLSEELGLAAKPACRHLACALGRFRGRLLQTCSETYPVEKTYSIYSLPQPEWARRPLPPRNKKCVGFRAKTHILSIASPNRNECGEHSLQAINNLLAFRFCHANKYLVLAHT